jgi:hypothetical protein
MHGEPFDESLEADVALRAGDRDGPRVRSGRRAGTQPHP